MGFLIIICQLIVIVLYLQDRIAIKKRAKRKQVQERNNLILPDIMGQPKLRKSPLVPYSSFKGQIQEAEINTDNLDIEYDEHENVGIQIPREELDEVFSNLPDFEEEEEEWNTHGIAGGDDGLAQGVTFEELSSVGMLLQKENLEQSQKETAIALVQKIQGTELFSLLENSMEGASRKIAQLLDCTLSSETEASSSILRKDELNDFDIGEFV